ncbi:hypothetical protein ColLi_13304 [Colletotrichum liriopes]|uniref:Uncharacterized protein n=1 Tax=Colletotrichum liriopes TaxID=708192 RepID=A0AA37GZY7_9PEZI|nr:hypothetical protein ColLi_13304 [Colletotrichum liriopes]
MPSAHVSPPPYCPKTFPLTIRGTPTKEVTLRYLVESGMMEWVATVKEWTGIPGTGPGSSNIYVAEQVGNHPGRFFLVRRTMDENSLGVMILESVEDKTI